MTPTAYMTDAAWLNMTKKMCEGIRAMPVIKDHEDWWCLMSVDGFGSHLSPAALEIFARFNILMIKEEGDTSHMCQAYDQEVARSDKRWTREILDAYRLGVHGVLSQWELILGINAALNKADPKAWRRSHIRVNMCPSRMTSFADWLRKHEKTVAAADRFFESRDSLFEAMPAVWKNLTHPQREVVACLFQDFEEEAEKNPGCGGWHISH